MQSCEFLTLTNVIGVWIVERIHNSWMLFPSAITNSILLLYYY